VPAMPRVELVSSGTSRHGRRFEPVQELELHQSVVEVADAVSDRSEAVLIAEPPGPFGVPDFVLLREFDRVKLQARVASRIAPLLNEVDAGIVAAATAVRSISITRLAAKTGWSESTVLRRVPDLVKLGALREPRPGMYVKASELQPVGHSIAIEAKLKDWRKALRQARSYAYWCDNYVLVLGPLGPAVVDEVSKRVRADRGGLVVAGDWIVRPRPRSVPAGRQFWGSEYLVASLFDYQPSASPKRRSPR
jgi:DNA-binding Lrp family transcriptional regulator